MIAQTESVGRKKIDSALANIVQDTARCRVLNAMIEAEPDDRVWPLYNSRMEAICQQNLLKYKDGDPLYKFFMKYLASSLNNKGYLANVQGDLETALKNYEESMAMDERSENLQGVATSLNNIGSIYQVRGDVVKAMSYYQRSLQLREKTGDKQGTAESYNNIGLLYNEQGDIPQALKMYHLGLKIDESIGDRKGLATLMNNIGEVYQQQGDATAALNYYHQSLKILEENKDSEGLPALLHNIGHIHLEKGEYGEARTFFERSYQISKETGNKAGMANCLSSLGALSRAQRDLKKALEYWQKSLVFREEIDDKQGMSMSMERIAAVLLETGQPAAAKKYGEQSLELARKLGFPYNIQNSSGTLVNIYKAINDWRSAFQMLALNRQMSDSINSQAVRKASIQKRLQYEYEKKTAADSIRAVGQRKVFDAEMKQQKTQRTALYIGIALVMLFALFMMNRFRVTKKQKLIIEAKERETQQQKRVIEEKHKEISDSINYAERIQRSLMATDTMLSKRLGEHFVVFRPKAVVSGDFYWAAELRNGDFALVVADSTGHGVPGAIMSLINITSLEKAIESTSEPAEILNLTRRIIIDRLSNDGSEGGGRDGMDGSLVSFNFGKQKMTYAAANNPVLLIRDGELTELHYDNMPIGKHSGDQETFTQQEISLSPGDAIYCITDGMPDQFGGPKGKKYMYRQLKQLLLSLSGIPMPEQKRVIEQTLTDWMGEHEQIDDITLVGIRVS